MKIRYSENLLFFCEHNVYRNFHLFTQVWSRSLVSYTIITYQSTEESKLVVKLCL